MENGGYTRPGLYGKLEHYDSKGHMTGYSRPSMIEDNRYDEFDAKGNMIGFTRRNVFGEYVHYDNKGHRTGSTKRSLHGFDHYDAGGKVIGSSARGALDKYEHTFISSGRTGTGSVGKNSTDVKNGGACYIATCVYGSYDTPELWIFRRFRDGYLGSRGWGRAFIRVYYAVSPVLVFLFGRSHWFRSFWRRVLDRIAADLRKKGYEDTRYSDID